MSKFYLSVTRDSKGKKRLDFGGSSWGAMPRKDANARGVETGNGLMVLDIDTKDLTKIDKKLIKLLPDTPTVETANGYHWYFTGKRASEIKQTQGITKLVDIRNEGGFVFDKYWGTDSTISYKRVGEEYKLDKKLCKYLHKLYTGKTVEVREALELEVTEPYPKFEDGEQHEMLRLAMQQDFINGATYDEVYSKGQKYIKDYLAPTKHEQKLMQGRLDFAFKHFGKSLGGEAVRPAEIASDMTEEDIEEVVEEAVKQGKLTSVRKKLKKVGKDAPEIIEEVKERVQQEKNEKKEELQDGGLAQFFEGELIFEPEMGVYAEVFKTHVRMFKKSNFSQVVMSLSGWMTPSHVNEMLCSVPIKHIIYRPTETEGEVTTQYGEIAINVYKAPKLRKAKARMPKVVQVILDNLFLEDMAAQVRFIHWMAYIVQTGNRTGVAYGFFGASGSGKTLMAEIFAAVLGMSNSSLNVGDVDLQSSFNPYAYNKQFIHLNEVASDFHSRHGVAGKLKALISDSIIRINQKGLGEISVENYANIILNSNKPNPIELDHDDRRWNMIVSTRSLKDVPEFKKGVNVKKVAASLRAYLLEFKVDAAQATAVVDSEAKKSVTIQTSSPLQQVANCINTRSGLVELLGIDNNVGLVDGIEEAEESGFYPNQLLTDILKYVDNRYENMTSMQMVTRFRRPYIKGETTKRKNIRGILV